MTKLILTLAIVLLVGCSPQAATELVMDPTLSPEQMAAVVEAADDWCANVPEFCVPVFVGEDRGNGYVTHRAKCWEGVGAKTHLTFASGPVVEMCDDADRMKFIDVISVHELGHALTGDMSHIEAPGHAMSVNNLAAVAKVTPLDVEWSTN